MRGFNSHVGSPSMALVTENVDIFTGFKQLMSRLRKKIEADPKNPAIIKTVWGGGYSFAADVDELRWRLFRRPDAAAAVSPTARLFRLVARPALWVAPNPRG